MPLVRNASSTTWRLTSMRAVPQEALLRCHVPPIVRLQSMLLANVRNQRRDRATGSPGSCAWASFMGPRAAHPCAPEDVQ